MIYLGKKENQSIEQQHTKHRQTKRIDKCDIKHNKKSSSKNNSRKLENYQCLWFLIQLSQNSEPHWSHEINCPGLYPVKQLSQAVPFTDILKDF